MLSTAGTIGHLHRLMRTWGQRGVNRKSHNDNDLHIDDDVFPRLVRRTTRTPTPSAGASAGKKPGITRPAFTRRLSPPHAAPNSHAKHHRSLHNDQQPLDICSEERHVASYPNIPSNYDNF